MRQNIWNSRRRFIYPAPFRKTGTDAGNKRFGTEVKHERRDVAVSNETEASEGKRLRKRDWEQFCVEGDDRTCSEKKEEEDFAQLGNR